MSRRDLYRLEVVGRPAYRPSVLLHAESCRYRIAALGAAAIECEHGFEVCPDCDPCTCVTGLRNVLRAVFQEEGDA